MSCNWCYHSGAEHDPVGNDCGDGVCRTCQAKDDAARKDRVAFLTKTGRDPETHLLGIDAADSALEDAIGRAITDRRLLADELRRVGVELDRIRAGVQTVADNTQTPAGVREALLAELKGPNE